MSICPKISVVIPLFNKAAFIANTLRSVLSQHYQPLEIIVIDDGSTDGSHSIVESFGENSLIRLIRQQNAGVSSARNRGIREAKGDFIAFLDADDYWFPDYLSEIRSLIESHPEADQYATAFVLSTSPSDHRRSVTASNHRLIQDYYSAALNSDPFCTCSICVRRSSFFRYEIWFPVSERLGEDLDVWFRLSEISPAAVSQRQCVAYYKGDQSSLTYSNAILEPIICFRNLRDRLDRELVPKELRASATKLVSSHWINVARNLAQKNRLREAWQFMNAPVAHRNFSYWIRTVAWLAIRTIVKRTAKN